MRKIGLVLGGGGARGLSHIGALKILQREKLPIHCIAGTSMGALVGACYAVNPDVNPLERMFKSILAGSMFSKMKFNIFKEEKHRDQKSIFRKAQDFIKYGYLHLIEETHYSLLDIERLEEIINFLLPDIELRETQIPFACVATDLTNGVEKIFTKGPLRKAVLASASIPGIFPPVRIGDVYYNDGGAVSVTPINAAKRLGADFTIAFDVKSKIVKWDKPEKAKEILSRSNYITGVLLNEAQLKEADVVVAPGVKHMHWVEFDKIDFMIEEGAKATEHKMREIRTKLRYRDVSSRMLDFFGLGKKKQKMNESKGPVVVDGNGVES